jgi:hypothetical protein
LALHLYNYYRTYDPQMGRYIESDPIGLKGGINTYAFVGGNPIQYYDPLGLTQRDIEAALLIAEQIQTDLIFPDHIAVQPLAPPMVGLTLNGVGTAIDVRYLKKLTDAQACELLNTIIHEAIHYTLPSNDARQKDVLPCGKPGGYPYDEAKRRTTPELCQMLNTLRTAL